MSARVACAWVLLTAAVGAPGAGAAAPGAARYELSQTEVALRDDQAGGSRYAVTGATAFAQPVPGAPKRYEIRTAAKRQAAVAECAAGENPIVFNDGFEQLPLAVR